MAEAITGSWDEESSVWGLPFRVSDTSLRELANSTLTLPQSYAVVMDGLCLHFHVAVKKAPRGRYSVILLPTTLNALHNHLDTAPIRRRLRSLFFDHNRPAPSSGSCLTACLRRCSQDIANQRALHHLLYARNHHFHTHAVFAAGPRGLEGTVLILFNHSGFSPALLCAPDQTRPRTAGLAKSNHAEELLQDLDAELTAQTGAGLDAVLDCADGRLLAHQTILLTQASFFRQTPGELDGGKRRWSFSAYPKSVVFSLLRFLYTRELASVGEEWEGLQLELGSSLGLKAETTWKAGLEGQLVRKGVEQDSAVRLALLGDRHGLLLLRNLALNVVATHRTHFRYHDDQLSPALWAIVDAHIDAVATTRSVLLLNLPGRPLTLP